MSRARNDIMTAADVTSQVTAQGSASGSSFYAAMRILPREQRDAMFQIYSFCRQVDDIADSDGPRPGRLAALDSGGATSMRSMPEIHPRA
jgi:phytoene/squalene synthetase